MPFPNFHAARVKNPSDFVEGSFRTKQIKTGITIITGRLKTDPQGSAVTQSYRFDKKIYTSAQARKWLKNNKVKATFEPAIEVDSFDVDYSEGIELERTPEGFAIVRFDITRPGVFDYPEEGLKKLKTEDNVNDPAILNTLIGQPITYTHPKKDNKPIAVDINNFSDYSKGVVTSWYFDEKKGIPRGKGKIYDSELIDLVEKKQITETSPGFWRTDIQEPGLYNNKKYDVKQIIHGYNHLAFVDRGRAGNTKIEGDNMPKNVKLEIDSVKYEVDEAVKLHVTTLESTVKKLTSDNLELKELNKKLETDETAKAEITTLQGKVNALKLQFDEYKKLVPEQVKQQSLKLVDAIETCKLCEIEIDEKEYDTAILQKKVIELAGDGFKEALTDDNVEAMYQAAKVLLKEKSQLSGDSYGGNTGNSDPHRELREFNIQFGGSN